MSAKAQSIPCYYINLDQSTARAQHMEAEFERLGIRPIRYPAVVGLTMAEDEQRALNPLAPNAWVLSSGEIGCFLSHRNTWELIANNDAPFGAVFEDDIRFADDAAAFLNASDWIPEGVDCIKLDTSDRRVLLSDAQGVEGSTRQLLKSYSEMTGCAGYIVSKRFAQTILDQMATMIAPLDIQLYNPIYASFPGMAVWQLSPAICIQQFTDTKSQFLAPTAEVSIIHDSRTATRQQTQPKLEFGGAKIWREICRPFYKIRDRIGDAREARLRGATWVWVEYRD